MTQSELNQRVEERAQKFGATGFSKRDLLYAAALLNIPGRSQMTLDELSASVTTGLPERRSTIRSARCSSPLPAHSSAQWRLRTTTPRHAERLDSPDTEKAPAGSIRRRFSVVPPRSAGERSRQLAGSISDGITAPETFGVTFTLSEWMIGCTYWRSGIT